ncbi:mannitol dehydrogenase family protein [Nonomuraea jiangxiensis]|uniref:Fructuronate reductase n=1 Tax=Nonomuraea jiangxiensis TaxID=633440 RepID=A0A1G9BFC7_9ACTN|nr:mannitol dehydrogenase family protein [Nonomuraea jiangxiensis]SDK38228.1 fructuronate reductase [Nonomuraea jiangxiensis]
MTRTARPRLDAGSLPRADAGHRPSYDLGAVRVGIVHLGFGAFHRAHQAVAFDRMLERFPDQPWGVCAVANTNAALVRAAREQDHLFAVATVGTDPAAEPEVRVVGSIRESLLASEAAEAVVARLAAPQIHTITLTITERGYAPPPGAPADSLLGLLALALDRRRAAGLPVTVLSCDNLVDNGTVLRAALLDLVERQPGAFSAGLPAWLGAQARFPRSVVDRIVPKQTAADRDRISGLLGLDDALGLVAEETFHWTIEADEAMAAGTAWADGGVVFSPEIDRVQQLKLQLLNATHSLLAYAGLALGIERVSDAARHPDVAALAARFLATEALPSVVAPAGTDPAAYADSVRARFASPLLPDTTARVATDGSQKLPQRLTATLLACRESGRRPRVSATVLALWMHLRTARPDAFSDENARDLRIDAATPDTLRASVSAALADVVHLPAPVATDPELVGAVTHALTALLRGDPPGTLIAATAAGA